MWKSTRVSSTIFAALLLIPGTGFIQRTLAAGAVTAITILELPPVGPFTAGVSTPIAGTSSPIFFNVQGDPGTPPDGGQVIVLELLRNGEVVTGGMNPVSFTTVAGDALYVPGSDIPGLTFFTAGANNITLRARLSGGTPSDTSTSFSVLANTANKLVAYTPVSQSLLPGHDPTVNSSAVSGSPLSPEANEDFSVTVRMTDAYFNPVAATDVVALTADDPSLTTISAAGALVGGERVFTVSLGTPRITRILIPSDQDPPTAEAVPVTVQAAGPPPEEVFPFPNPFNPHTGAMTLRVGVDQPQSVTLKIVDPSGQPIWERSVNATSETNILWDGRNDNGQIVAAGFYYVLLDIGGSIKSKKKIGVVK